MAKPRHVDQDRIDDALFITQVADKRLVDPDRMAEATETVNAALDEMDHFCDPANAAHIGRFEALRYAWKASPVFRTFMLVLGAPCAFMGLGTLLGKPWPAAVPQALQFLGLFGTYPLLVGAAWLVHAWWKPEELLAYTVRAAPILLIGGAALVILGLLSTSLA